MNIVGSYFNGVTSRKTMAEMTVFQGSVSVQLESPDEMAPESVPLTKMNISSRLDNVPRSLRFPSGELFITDNNDAVDDLLQSNDIDVALSLAHRLESYWPLVIVSIIGIMMIAGGLYQYGIPAIADRAAALVPTSIEQEIGDSVLTELGEKGILAESLYENAELRTYFESYKSDQPVTILFRASSFFGPNAFALPGGTIVFTDSLLDLSENNEELLAIYFHELGHVENRHMIKQGLRRSLLTMVIMMVTGDLTAATDLVVMFPTLLLSLSYSRDLEREADEFALAKLQEVGVDSVHFANIMNKLMKQGKSTPFWMSSEYLSTHPAPQARLMMIEANAVDQ